MGVLHRHIDRFPEHEAAWHPDVVEPVVSSLGMAQNLRLGHVCGNVPAFGFLVLGVGVLRRAGGDQRRARQQSPALRRLRVWARQRC